ncbi:hypothetical protein ACIOWF_20580 [Cellulosimicrobium cellulans]|uniref:hypothetical protein n=1 Tax=Cellulosimicrobium cellulans TaxID=1710 RepID=UPI00380F9C75
MSAGLAAAAVIIAGPVAMASGAAPGPEIPEEPVELADSTLEFYDTSAGVSIAAEDQAAAEAQMSHLVKDLDPAEVDLLSSGAPLYVEIDFDTLTYTSVEERGSIVSPLYLTVGGTCSSNGPAQSCLSGPPPWAPYTGLKIVGHGETNPLWAGWDAIGMQGTTTVNATVCGAYGLGCAAVPKNTYANFRGTIHVNKVYHD